MGFLRCYTLNEKIADGIDADAFECINVEDPSATRISKAVLEFIPLFTCKEKSTAAIASKSLTFLVEPKKDDKEDSAGVILAFDPKKWRLCYNANLYTLLDPCGMDGAVMIMADRGSRNVLAKADQNNITVSISADNKPVVAKCRRAGLLYSAVKGQLLYKELNILEAPHRKAGPTKRAKSAHS